MEARPRGKVRGKKRRQMGTICSEASADGAHRRTSEKEKSAEDRPSHSIKNGRDVKAWPRGEENGKKGS